MRIAVCHETRYTYAPPARSALQLLRVTPRSHEGQHVRAWRISVDCDCRLRQAQDWLGNIMHAFEVDGPLESLQITIEGEVETQDASGLVTSTVEPFPPVLFLRETRLTEPDAAIRSLAEDATRLVPHDPLARLHELMTRLHKDMRFDTGVTDAATTAATAFAARHGVCQDFAHIFIAAARACNIPARYVSGYLARADGDARQEAGHGWAEAYVPDLGWVGFDPANSTCPTEAYVRVAIGLDYLGAAPVTGSRQGGGSETLDVRVLVERAQSQAQQ
jgi:transglutaminase-like putative cysteine protease